MNLKRYTKFNQWDATDCALPRVFYGGGKSQSSTSQVSVPPEILAQYQNVNSIAGQVASTPFQQYSSDPNAFVAPLTATQQAGVLGTNQYSNEAQPFYQAASNQNQASTAIAQGATAAAGAPVSSQQIQNYENPYLSDVINPTSQLLEQQFNQAQSGQLGNAIQNGSFGGDRSAVAAANLQQQQSLAYGQTIGGLENQNYTQALGEANTEQQAGLQAANQYGALGQSGATNEANIGSGAQAAGLAGAQAQLTAGQAQQQTEQAGLTALYNQFLQQQSYPFQTTQFLANIAEGTGALSGSTTSTNQPSPYFSDERLKEDIQKIGKLNDGLNVIKFKYKGDKQTHIGLSAQDVEKKHPEAIGLAGGYKTVDYDAATKDAADRGRKGESDSDGGLVAPLRSRGRAHFAGGGLAPNSAADAGFVLDPTYLQAQEAAYGNAPWGNAGPVTGSSPYGGKSHVPASASGAHASLSVAHPPSSGGSSGLQGLSQGIGQLEGLGKTGKTLFNDVKGYVPGLGGAATSNAPSAGSASAAPQPAGLGIGTGQPGAPPPSRNQPVEANPSPVQPTQPDASAGPIAGLSGGANDNAGLGAVADAGGSAGGLGASLGASLGDDLGDDLGAIFSKRGGLIKRAGGGPTYAQPTDDNSDDNSAGGDVPYDSGTGSGGLDIPDDKSNNQLAVAQPPQQQGGGGGGFNPLGILTGALGLFGLERGGRVGLAGGGDPGDGNGSDITLPNMDDPSVFSQGLAGPDQARALAGIATPEHNWGPRHAGGTPTGPIIPDDADSASAIKPMPRAAKAAPTAGLNPDVPSPDAQPVQQVQDMGSPPQGHITQPGEVLAQDNPGGVGDWLNKNQGLLVPALHGLGTMASSNSRYLGSAILQGLGGAADSYEQTQNEMQGRSGNQPIIQQRQNDALQSDLNAWQSYTAQTGANLSFSDFEKIKNQGKLSANQGAPSGVPNGNSGLKYTVQEKNSLVLPNGVRANQDPAYLAQFSQKNAGIHSEMVAGQVHQANQQAADINGQNFTYNSNGQQVLPQGFNSRVVAQNQPAQQTAESNQYRGEALDYAKQYGRTSSLLNEMDSIYQGYQAGPTAAWRSQAEKLIQDFDPQGKILGHTPAGEDNDKIMKDIGQLTASQLASMPSGAPKDAHELMNSFAATPDKSPGALRDLIIRGKAYTQQMNDYYNGFDPSSDPRSVFQYQKQFFSQNPYDKYRTQLEKTTPAYAGQSSQGSAPAAPPHGGKGIQVAPGIPNVNSPDDARRLPSGTVFMTPDGRRLVAP